MGARYYDDAVIQKLQKWIPENSNLRILKPDESKRLFELTASDSKDKPLQMPFIALSRDNDIQIGSTIKQLRSFNGVWVTNNKFDYSKDPYGRRIIEDSNETAVLNAIPIKLAYKLDIYTKKYDEGDEYLRNFLFKLINNPQISIIIPYQGAESAHRAYIRVLDSVSDTSSITERIFSGQFTRWTIQFEIQDAYLFSIPYKKNWKIGEVSIEATDDLKLEIDKENVEIVVKSENED